GGAGTISLATGVGGSGAVNIGTGGVSGTLVLAQIFGGQGTSSVNFNHTDDVTFTALMNGNLGVTKAGSGRTTLTNTNTYTGGTTVTGGALSVTGSIGGAVAVKAATAILMGTG